MQTYAFLLGRKPLISLAELTQVLGKETEYLNLHSDILIAKCNFLPSEANTLLHQLGGSIKIIEILPNQPTVAKSVAHHLSQYAQEFFAESEGKIRFAVYAHSLRDRGDQVIKSSLMEIKKGLKKIGKSCRFINNNFQNAEIAALKGEKVIEKGAEFCAIETEKGWLVGKTAAIQDIDGYTLRDIQRPERDPRMGMLPPKLAQILINLSGINKLDQLLDQSLTTRPETIYDPFCGLGTVLMEGALMKFNVVGSDQAPDVLKNCQKNLDWIFTGMNLSSKFQLFIKDAAKLTAQDFTIPVKSIEAVVSETYLGPPMSITPSLGEIETIFQDLENTLSLFLKQIKPLLTENSRMVLTLLTYRNNTPLGPKYYQMEKLLGNLEKFGFTIDKLIPDNVAEKFKISSISQETLLYERPDQIVCRGIYKLKLLK